MKKKLLQQYCKGAKFTLNGKQHKDMLKLKTTQVTMSEVKMLKILDNVELERQSIKSMKCIVGSNT